MTDSDQIAEFIAKRGVTKIAEGEASLGHWSKSDWRKAYRGEPTSDDLISQRILVATDHAGREFWVNGLGERIT